MSRFNQNVNSERAQHYIFNYQYNKEGLLLRTEAYIKDYGNLIKYNTDRPQFNAMYNNNGSGYARGFDVFWRDSKTVKNTDYWVSYSYIDSERDWNTITTDLSTLDAALARIESAVGGPYDPDQ